MQRLVLRNIVTLILFIFSVFSAHSQERYPVHVMVELPPPHSVYLEDYVTGSRDRMVVTLLNRDAMRAELEVKLELEVSGAGFRARSRGEVYHSRIVLDAGVPLRLGSETLGEYLRQGAVETEGMPSGGRLPVGMTEFRVRAVDYATGRALSEWASRRIWLDERKPPVLNSPGDGESLAWKEQQRIRFGWMPMQAGMSGTEYEIVIKEIPDNGVPASESFAYGRELLRERTRRTFHIHDMGYEPLYAGRRYAWQVRALAAEGSEPVSYANGGYSEVWSFTVDERMLSPVGLKAEAKPGRVKLIWGAVPESSGYVVQMREKSEGRDYEWKETESADEGTEFHNLRNGWAYEWRVGSRNASGRRYWSGVSEFVVPERAEDLLKDCGKVPEGRSLSGEPYLGLKVGDIVTVGGDYPMEVTEVTPLGDGWYSGTGRTRIRSIIDAPVRLVFDRVRINTELCQTDGEVKVGYDESNGLIVETDRIDDGGEGIKGKSGVSYPEGYVEAVFPENPEFEFVEGSGELRFKDAEGHEQSFRLGDASLQGEGEDGRKIGGEAGFPVLLTDRNGTTYKVYPKEGSDSTGHRQMVCEKMERIEGFDSSRLSLGSGAVRFEKGEGEYGFDAGEEKWYAKSVKLDRFYKASGKGYIAPWKLLPKGRRDHVVARYVGRGKVKTGEVRFATKDGTVLKSEPLDGGEEEPSGWKVWLDGTERGSSYEVYAVYHGKSIGKLNVMGTEERDIEVTVVPVNGISIDEGAIEEGLGRIYGPAGVRVKVRVDRKMTGDMYWDTDGDGRLMLAGGGSGFGYEDEMKESSEMLRLQKSYEAKGTEGSGAVLFVLDGASESSGGVTGLLGEMPRRNRYGYVFAGEGTGTESLVRTIAHELGHGVFTLRHTFDGEYGGEGSRGTTDNLMDYGGGTGLAAFQWNVMGSPAILTKFDSEDEFRNRSLGIQKSLFEAESRLRKLGPDYVVAILNCEDVVNAEQIRNEVTGGIPFKSEVKTVTEFYLINLKSNVSTSYPEQYNDIISRTESLDVHSSLRVERNTITVLRSDGYGAQAKIKYCVLPVENYPSICSVKNLLDKRYSGRFFDDIRGCMGKSEEEQYSKITRMLAATKDFYGAVEFEYDRRIYTIDKEGRLVMVENPLSDDEISKGRLKGDVSEMIRFGMAPDGIIQIKAFGINPRQVKPFGDKIVIFDTYSKHIKERGNILLSENRVTDLTLTPDEAGVSLSSSEETFADGGRFMIDVKRSFAKLLGESYGISKHLLQTTEVLPAVYMSSSDAMVKAPGLVTGLVEVSAQKVTDMTSLVTFAYDMATDKDTQKGIEQSFREVKTAIGNDPKQFFPIVGNILLSVATGNNAEEWDKALNTDDRGQKSHLLVRGVGNAFMSVNFAASIVGLSKISGQIAESARAVRKSSEIFKNFMAKSLPDKLEDIKRMWSKKYPYYELFDERSAFEQIMREYRYKTSDGWGHTADISPNFKGVDFYKDFSEKADRITAKTGVSMKTTSRTDVNEWLKSNDIQKNIENLSDGLQNGIKWNNTILRFEKVELHIYVPKENIHIREEWMRVLNSKYPDIEFKMNTVEEFIK